MRHFSQPCLRQVFLGRLERTLATVSGFRYFHIQTNEHALGFHPICVLAGTALNLISDQRLLATTNEVLLNSSTMPLQDGNLRLDPASLRPGRAGFTRNLIYLQPESPRGIPCSIRTRISN